MQFTLSQIAQICSGVHYGADATICQVVVDSRSAIDALGTMFVAMKGVNHDSHNYIDSMQRRGVKAFLAERYQPVPEGCGIVVVENSIAALQALAAYRRAHFAGEVIGVTGSNGKTMVKEWIAQSVKSGLKLYRSPRSYNSQLGVALSLLMMPDDATIALIEAGISQVGEMERLERMIAPDTVIFTSFGDAHQANFSSEEQKALEKLTLAKNAKRIIYNSAYKGFAATLERLYSDRELIDTAGVEIAAQSMPYADNARIVAAFCTTYSLATPDFSIMQPVAMRLEVKQGVEDSIIVDDSYSSDIDSLTIALDYLKSVSGSRRKIVILSDILQSGLEDSLLYSSVAEKLSKCGVNLFVGVGSSLTRHSALFSVPSLFFADTQSLIEHLTDIDVSGAALLIKGNRGSRIERVSHLLELKSHTTCLEVNLRAMERNINYFRSQLSPQTKLVAMVKASSYGAGDSEVARMLCKQGVDYLAVAFTDEGVRLRNSGVEMPIVVLNADDNSFDTMVAHNLEPEIYSLRSLDCFARAARGKSGYPIHIKFDTGMHRLGFEEQDIEPLLERIARYSNQVKVASVFTHLCAADDATQDDFTRSQIALFDSMSSRLVAALGYPVLRHAAASAAMLRFAEAHFDMCRLGLGLYGYGYPGNGSLEAVSTLKTRIVQIREVAQGDSVGYGRAGVVTRNSRIATIPIGYADGLDRHLGCGRWSMLVAGKKAPTVGRICMDSCMIDVTDIADVEEGDSVTIFSPQIGSTAQDMALLLDTIPYEVLTSVSERVKRIYIYE